VPATIGGGAAEKVESRKWKVEQQSGQGTESKPRVSTTGLYERAFCVAATK